jgi:membrane fusion protein (multidrug efflux system)
MAHKKIYTVIAVLGLAAAGGAAWWWQNMRPSAPVAATAPQAGGPVGGPAAGGRPAGGPPGGGGPAAVEVGRVEAATLVDDVQAVGSLRSRQGVVLRPEVSGRIARLGFVDGQRVQRGQLMVQLDDTLQQAQLQQAEAQASIARTNLQRSRELLAQNFVSQSAVDQNQANLQVAESQVALARAQLARMKVLAPFDATAGIRSVDVGDYVKDGADVVRLEDLSQISVEFRLPERYVGRVRAGLPVEVTLDALRDRVFAGRVEALDSQVGAEGRALLVRARIDNPGALLKPGMFARTRIVMSSRENALLVPEEALVPQGSTQLLYKVVDGPDGKVARRLEAKIGLRQPGRVEILEGLQPGDQVVTAGHARLRGDAMPVRVIDIDRAAAAPPPAAGPAAATASAPTAGASGARPLRSGAPA